MAAEGEGRDEAVLTFQLTWGLDEKCIDFVCSLPTSVQGEVIRQFQHAPEQTNPSARCMAFAKKVMQELGSATSLPEFQAKWGIDEKCTEFLASLPEQVLSTVIASFYQKPEQTNVSARCQAFAQSVLRRQGGGALAATRPAFSASPAIRLGGALQQGARPMLIPPTVRRQPDPLLSLQVNAPLPAAITRLGRPARSASSGGEDYVPGGDDAVSHLLEFQSRWGLDDTCVDYLGSLPPSLQMKLVTEFTHRPDQTNPSARCMAFARKILQTQSVVEDNSGALAEFQATWGIDETCLAYLTSMPPHVQAVVLSTFEHRPDQTNASARCQAFARSVLQRSGGAPPPQAAGGYSSLAYPAASVPRMVPPRVIPRPLEALAAPQVIGARRVAPVFAALPYAAAPAGAAAEAGPESIDLLQFQAMWGLDDRCMEHLQSLPAQVQATVLARFEHRPDQTNPSARCQAFAQSIMRGQQGSALLQDFQGKWGVDDRCMELLSSLPPHVQAIVTSGFEHRPDQTNVSARCMAFARSVLVRTPHAGFGPPAKAQRLA
mmetsp:Transcript_101765/g.270739  ORF Transcript_101765/g.270739 Transcript_101765/m.270739 type:complete len:547 (-) Transcript_101765:101-1741(-)